MSPREDTKIRKERILAITIERYINSVSPVSSSIIAMDYPLEISSATIRAVLAELEEDGYLTHPHTSAGRVPTELGYRYYVDHLMHEIQLLEEEKLRIKLEYQKERLELEYLINKTTQSLSEITNYTSLISVDGMDDRLFCQGTSYVVNYPELNDIKKISSILQALDDKKQIIQIINNSLQERKNILIGQEIPCTEIDGCSLVISSFRTKDGQAGKMAVLGPTRMNYERVVSALNYFSELIEDIY